MGAMKEPTTGLYRADYYAWVHDQSAALKRGDFKDLDLPNLIEEIEALGASQESELESRLEVLLIHLLKWQYQSVRRGRSWKATIVEQRLRLKRLFRRMPSLRAKLGDFLQEDYDDARVMTANETGLARTTFPVECPYTIEQLMDADWFPDQKGPHGAGLL